MISSDREVVTVLVIDDEPGDLDLIETYLCETAPEDYRVIKLERLADVADVVAAETPHVAVLDLNLPDNVGVSTVTHFHKIAPDVPVVVLTGRADDIGLQCITAGAEDFLPKAELDPINLRRAVRSALLRTRERQLELAETTQSRYREMSTSGSFVSVTSSVAGMRTVAESAEDYNDLIARYRVVVDRYLEHLIKQLPKPARLMQDLINELGSYNAGPRDLLDLHLAALDGRTNVRPTEAYAYAVESRLVALAMMGMLVDHYRIGRRMGH